MVNIQFSRTSDLGVLPDLVTDLVGDTALERICQSLEVPAEIVRQRESYILLRDSHNLFVHAAEITGRRDIGLLVGSQNRITDLGPIGHYVATAPSLAKGLTRAAETVRYTQDYSHQFVEYDGDHVRLGYRNASQGLSSWRHQSEIILCYLLDFFRSYLGEVWRPEWIEVCYGPGPWETDLEGHFGCPVFFNRPWDAMVIHRHHTDANPIQRSPARLVTKTDITRYARLETLEGIDAIREIIRNRLLIQRSDLDGLARKLAIGPRKLQRLFKSSGIEYRTIVSEERKKRAISLLSEPDLSLDVISKDLGYASRTQFIRAFKSWTSMRPSEFRHHIAQGSPEAVRTAG